MSSGAQRRESEGRLLRLEKEETGGENFCLVMRSRTSAMVTYSMHVCNFTKLHVYKVVEMGILCILVPFLHWGSACLSTIFKKRKGIQVSHRPLIPLAYSEGQ